MRKVDLVDLSTQTKIPVKVLQSMIKDGAFTEQMDDVDIAFINRIMAVIDKAYFLRHCLLRIRSDRRKNFIATASFETKWERYIYTNMANHYALGGEIIIKDFVKHAENVFQFDFTEEHVEKVKKIRNKIYQTQTRHNKKKTCPSV